MAHVIDLLLQTIDTQYLTTTAHKQPGAKKEAADCSEARRIHGAFDRLDCMA